jgi:hypothetical protein
MNSIDTRRTLPARASVARTRTVTRPNATSRAMVAPAPPSARENSRLSSTMPVTSASVADLHAGEEQQEGQADQREDLDGQVQLHPAEH